MRGHQFHREDEVNIIRLIYGAQGTRQYIRYSDIVSTDRRNQRETRVNICGMRGYGPCGQGLLDHPSKDTNDKSTFYAR